MAQITRPELDNGSDSTHNLSGNYKSSYLTIYQEEFKFLDPECHDTRVREINMRTKRCNRCLGLRECMLHPSFWLAGEPERFALNSGMPENLDEARKVAPRAAYQNVITREKYDIPDEPETTYRPALDDTPRTNRPALDDTPRTTDAPRTSRPALDDMPRTNRPQLDDTKR